MTFGGASGSEVRLIYTDGVAASARSDPYTCVPFVDFTNVSSTVFVFIYSLQLLSAHQLFKPDD